MALQDETGLLKNKVRTKDRAKVKATPEQWESVDMAIKAFSNQYPKQWEAFVKDQVEGRDAENPYKMGKDMKSKFRHTASFPVILNSQKEITDGLLSVLEGIIPGLTDKHSVNFEELLERYPIFRPSEKDNLSDM